MGTREIYQCTLHVFLTSPLQKLLIVASCITIVFMLVLIWLIVVVVVVVCCYCVPLQLALMLVLMFALCACAVSINWCSYTYILDPLPHVQIQLKSVVCWYIFGVGVVVECLHVDCSYNMHEVLVIPYGEWFHE